MLAYLRRNRALLAGALVSVVLLATAVPAGNARATSTVDWFGWGAKVDFANNSWKVTYSTYLGVNSSTPHVVSSSTDDISGQCVKRGAGTLSFPSADSAYFDGKVYIQCSLPSFRGELAKLGFVPPSGDQPFCPCTLGGGPLWADAQVRQLTTNGTMPLLDASDRGVRVNLTVNGAQASTNLVVRRTQPPGGYINYTSPQWGIDSAGNRTVVGWDGDAIVAVADHFHWLDYLTDQNWRPFFQTNVVNNKIGYWNESPTQSGTNTLTGNYELGMSGGTLYIGYSPSTGKYFKGEIDEGGIDPGCSGA